MGRSLTCSSFKAGFAFLCLMVLAFSLFPRAAAAQTTATPDAGDGQFFDAIGRTVLAAIATSPAGDAAESLGESVAMLDARFRVQARMRRVRTEAADAPAEAEAAHDPTTLPPASAGSNGTHVPHSHSLPEEEIFAHTRAAADPESTAILLTGVALAPPQAPEAVKGAINAANTIVGRPYVWGGGHHGFYSSSYDCSGAVSFALFGGGLIPRPLTSSELEHWGVPGPGRWITVYANASHTFAEIAGLRWDTVGDEKGTGPRWHLAPTSADGFVVRHPPGY
jgi:cell wall-associated NlpC family hydrolase